MYHHPFVVLMGCDKDNQPVATQVPVLIKERDEKIYLQGHIMRSTDHHKAFENNPNVLALFNGPHTYVSASWYTNPQQGSTWNYMNVQAKGLLIFKDEIFLLNTLKETTAHFENNPASPAQFEHLPNHYIQKLVKAIIGFEIQVTSIEHVFKLSQNSDEESYKNIVEQLQKGDDSARWIASQMGNKF